MVMSKRAVLGGVVLAGVLPFTAVAAQADTVQGRPRR